MFARPFFKARTMQHASTSGNNLRTRQNADKPNTEDWDCFGYLKHIEWKTLFSKTLTYPIFEWNTLFSKTLTQFLSEKHCSAKHLLTQFLSAKHCSAKHLLTQLGVQNIVQQNTYLPNFELNTLLNRINAQLWVKNIVQEKTTEFSVSSIPQPHTSQPWPQFYCLQYTDCEHTAWFMWSVWTVVHVISVAAWFMWSVWLRGSCDQCGQWFMWSVWTVVHVISVAAWFMWSVWLHGSCDQCGQWFMQSVWTVVHVISGSCDQWGQLTCFGELSGCSWIPCWSCCTSQGTGTQTQSTDKTVYVTFNQMDQHDLEVTEQLFVCLLKAYSPTNCTGSPQGL